MNYMDTLMTDMTDVALQTAFRAYYEGLGVQVSNWAGLFEEISAAADCFFVRRDEGGQVIGFLLFTITEATTAWRSFFSTRLGCIEEFWIAPEHRGQGHGRQLLRLAEKHFAQLGCAYAILTTDTAPGFYEKHGYCHEPGIQARNKDAVFVKRL